MAGWDDEDSGEAKEGVPGSVYARASANVDGEREGRLEVVEGEVPQGLRGVLFRNGPGQTVRFGQPYRHPFDGDGMITRFAFSDDGIDYRNRFVRTREFEAEERAQAMLFRSFGTNLPGGLKANLFRMRFKNAANTSVVHHGGRLLALWEGGLPHALDPDTLETLGRFDYGGALRNRFSWLDRLLNPELPFSAHPQLDPNTGDLHNFGTAFGPVMRLILYVISPDGRCRIDRTVTLERLAFVHDFLLTPRYRVFFLTPVAFDVPRALLGLVSPADALSMEPGRPTEILVVPRDNDAPVQRYTARAGFIFHFAGGYEDAEGRIVCDGFRMERLPTADDADVVMRGGFSDFPPSLLTRYTLTPDQREAREETLSAYPGELPARHPGLTGRRHRYVWSTSGNPETASPIHHGLMKLDLDARATLRRDFRPDLPGEPLFVPRPGAEREDDGWVLTLVYVAEAHRTDLLVLDASDLSTVCRARLPHHVPPGFHGTWVGAR